MVEQQPGGVVTRAVATGSPRSRTGALRAGAQQWQRAVGVVLVLGWVVWLACALLALPRPVSAGTLEQDLAAGRVASWHPVLLDRHEESLFQWVDRREPSPVAPGSEVAPPERRTVGYLVDGVVGRYRVVDVTGVGDELAQRMRDAGVPLVLPLRGDPGTVVPPDVERWGAVALGFAGFLLVVSGPRPTRGTRWFWFWLLGLPAGLGVLAYAVLEVLRPLPPHVPWAVPQGRMGGWRGFLVLVLGGILLAGGLDALGSWLGPAWTLPR
ncbi:hypothetical protein [Phycicoccus avicenniae]|uniref:hypothetical protein n=1 Tax=Phycicoccus avicenniae TaxID=2828860 RepID=UPI003D2803A4